MILLKNITSKPLSKDPSLSGYIFSKFSLKNEDSETNQAINIAKNILNKIKPIHFPIVFPEVFLSQKGGFNVILGNPPWKEVVINEDKFWARYNPGLTGLSAGKQTFLIEEFRKNRQNRISVCRSEYNRFRSREQISVRY